MIETLATREPENTCRFPPVLCPRRTLVWVLMKSISILMDFWRQTDRLQTAGALEVRGQIRVRGVQVLLLLAVVGFPLCMCCRSNESPSRKTVSSPVDTTPFLPSTVSVNTSHTFSTENNNTTLTISTVAVYWCSSC